MYEHGTTIVRGLTLVEALDTRRNEVWRAVAAGDDGERTAAVAVKLLHPAYEAIIPQRIRRRGRTLSRIVEHGTGWVSLLDHGYTTDGRRYLVSPLHRGSLADQLEHGPTPWYPSARLIADASFIVSEAHAAGYAFGHLRPSGILINGPAEVRVVTYGMSTRRFDDGTAQFMAPELADDGRPLPPSDVYSLALILASLIAGRPVDHRESRSEVIDELAGAPDRIVEIIEYGLSAGLRNRYADAGKFARTLDAALQEQHDSPRYGRSTPPPEAVDPLAALLAEPLVGIPDRRDAGRPDETPTAVPFDAPVDVPSIEIDDPTDPGFAARGELDTETDHFGALTHLDNRSATGDRPSAGPLADLLTVVDPQPGNPSRIDTPGPDVPTDPAHLIEQPGADDEADGSDGKGRMVDAEPARGRQAATRRPGKGSIIDIEAGSDGSPAVPPRRRPRPTESGTPTTEPSRMSVLVDNIGHFFAVRRRRIASPATTEETTTNERRTTTTEASPSNRWRRGPSRGP